MPRNVEKKRIRNNGAGSVFQEKNGRARWQLRDKHGKIVASGTCQTKTEATLALARAQTDLSRGILARKNGINLKDYAAGWLERQKVRPNTKHNYQKEINYALEELSGSKIQTTRPTQIKDALIALSKRTMQAGLGKNKPMSSRTLSMVRARLRSIFEEALQDGLIYTNPVRAVKRIKTEDDNNENAGIALDFHEADRLRELGTTLHESGVCRLWPAVFTALTIGLRRGEAAGLRWMDIDFQKNMLSVHQNLTVVASKPLLTKPKTKNSIRDIPIPASLRVVLEEHKAHQTKERQDLGLPWSEHTPVFATELGTYPHASNIGRALRNIIEWSNIEPITKTKKQKKRGRVTGQTVTKTISFAERLLSIPMEHRAKLEAVVKAGAPIRDITPHDLRHTAGTLMLRRKMPIEVVSKILGHANIAITLNVYRHVLESEKIIEMVDLFDAPLPRGKVPEIMPA